MHLTNTDPFARPATLPLTVTNPNPWPIRVLTIDTLVAAPDAPTRPTNTYGATKPGGSFAVLYNPYAAVPN
mgnify:CR=1 FL=1